MPEDERLLVVDPRAAVLVDGRVRDLPTRLRSGDVLVVNDAATLPASLHGSLDGGRAVELRLTAPPDGDRARVLLFGAGDWRTPTEHRPAPDPVAPGDVIHLAADLSARVVSVGARGRLLDVLFDAGDGSLLAALYAHGRPIQYSHVAGPLSLWHVQNRYASRPWAAEQPSAGHVLTHGMLEALRGRGVRVLWITHAAGISSTGDEELDRILPMPSATTFPRRRCRRSRRRERRAGG